MKFKLHKLKQNPSEYWNGKLPLPDEINVISPLLPMAEFQLLSILCSLHGYISPFDLLTGSQSDSEKDRDIVAVLTAFQWYLYPRLPLTHYSSEERRLISNNKSITFQPIDPKIE
jgi:hypothetical protein